MPLTNPPAAAPTHWPAQALLVDCDGVLADSDATVERAWSAWTTHYGLDFALVEETVHGRRVVESVAQLLTREQADDGVLLINKLELDDAPSTPAIAGAVALSQSLPADGWAVVTSGTAALARARLTAAGIQLPNIIVTADDVDAGKPAPDGYLLAASRLGAVIEQCIVLEDSPTGIAAARAAGVGRVVGIGARAHETDADIVVPDLSALAWADGVLTVTAGQ